MADWSKLPADLIVLIAGRLHFVEDYAKFGVVCQSWRAAILQKDHFSCSLLPWLMFADNETNDVRRFYSPFNKRAYDLLLPELRSRRCWGSSRGWLVTLNDEYQMHLFNPLSCEQILLPPLHKCPNLKNLVCKPEVFRDSFVCKVVLSSNPLLGSCVVLAICSDNKMAFAKPGDGAWTPLQCCPSVVNDVICYDGKFYATDSSGDVILCDSNGNYLKTVALASTLESYLLDEISTYIVEIGGQIHVFLRIMYNARYGDNPLLRTWSFMIYKLDIWSEKWEEVKCLGNWSVFIGSNHSFSLSSCDYPECSRNCIYFTDDYSKLYYDSTICSYDMGVYSLDNHIIQPLIPNDSSSFVYSPPVWVKPFF